MKALGMALCIAAASLTVPATADPISEFYRGKQIQFIIRSGVGNQYDQYARLLGRHIGRHIPGNPTIVPVNMPGGGGITAANYVAHVAPKDGTILTIVGQGLPVDQALHLTPTFKADLREFNWIGNLSNSNQVLVVWHTSKTKTLNDAKHRETLIGTTGAGSISTQLPALYNNVLGTKFKMISGYRGGAEVNLAMERGEVEGRGTNPWAAYKSVNPEWVRKKLIIPIIQTGLKKDPDLPDVPLLRDLGETPEEKQVLEYMSKAVAVGRPIATTPDVPVDRVAALRTAFDKTLSDPAFVEEAEKMGAEIDPMSGAELAQLVDDLIGAPDALRAKVKTAIVPAAADTRKLSGAAKSGGDLPAARQGSP